MALSRQGIIIQIIGDVKSYLTSAESVISTNTKLNSSFKQTGLSAEVSAKAQVAASLKMERAQTANIAALRALSVAPGTSRKEQATAARLAAEQETRLARAMGVSTVAGAALSREAQNGERSLNKLARGALAGSGAASALGRSLAFASTGFIAFAAGASIIRSSIDAARALEVANRQVARQLKTAGRSWATYRGEVNQTLLGLSHLSGFTRVDLLQSFGFFARVTDSVTQSLRLDAIAADVARGRHISLQAATLALSKAVGGSVSALRRLGIVVPKALTGWQAINFVAAKFAGQARAGTTAADRLNATWVDSKEIIGTALLPTLNRYLTGLGDWLSKMNETGKLQKDVTTGAHDLGTAVKDLTAPIRVLDHVTGGLVNTLKIFAAFKFATLVTGWVTDLELLATKWGLVTKAAEGAGAAQAVALGGAGVGGAAGAAARTGATAGEVGAATGLGAAGGSILARLLGRGKPARTFAVDTKGIATELPRDLGRLGGAAVTAEGKFALLAKQIGTLKGLTISAIVIPIALELLPHKRGSFLGDIASLVRNELKIANPQQPNFGPRAIDAQGNLINRPAGPVPRLPYISPLKGFAPPLFTQPSSQGPFGAAQPMSQYWKKFTLTFSQQLAQAQAALTKGSADDVAEAQKEIAKIKRLIDEGRLHGPGLLQGLALELQAINVVQSAAVAEAQARQAAAQKRLAARQKAQQALQARIQNAIDPLNLEVQLSRAQATGAGQKQILAILRAQRAAAMKAISSFHLTGANLKAAYDQITSTNQAIQAAIQNGTKNFTEPIRLQIALAREQALGLSTTSTLQKMKAAAMKAIRSGKFTGQSLVDLWNQIANINSQLGNSASSALGLFKQANIDKIVKQTGLTGAKARALKAQLSQLGPGNTIPGSGIGAAGFAINPETGRPIVVHTHINIDGKRVADNTTVHQQRHHRRNPSSRRGPNAAIVG